MSRDSHSTTLQTLRDSVSDLPTIPESLSRILALLEDDSSGARDLAAVIRRDPPLAAKVLRLANSPLYQHQRSIATVQECVALLGYRTVRQVALCVSVVASLGSECEKRRSLLKYRDVWRHGVAAGAVAKALAGTAGLEDPEEIFTCALLHDLGKLVLALSHPQDYVALIGERRRRGCPLVELERETFGFDHAQAGAVLAEAWHLPPVLAAAIGGHHDERPADPAVALVALADVMAHELAPSAVDLGHAPEFVAADDLCRAVGLDPQAVNDRQTELRRAITDLAPFNNLP